jgi:outer membrane protein assembly factor BamE (lipoprotein component of BamABCDE complex)
MHSGTHGPPHSDNVGQRKIITTQENQKMKTNISMFKHISLILACVSLCVGCMSTRQGNDFNSENVSKLKVGETTGQEVIQLIGQPFRRMRNSDGIVTLVYFYSPGQTVTPFSGFDPNLTRKAGQGMKQLTIILDANGKVQSFTENGQ